VTLGDYAQVFSRTFSAGTHILLVFAEIRNFFPIIRPFERNHQWLIWLDFVSCVT
jgi:hypothetical protein